MFSKWNSKSTITLSEADRTDLSNIIHENVLEEVPASEFLDALIDGNPLLIAEGIRWGFGDTVVRGQVVLTCSKMLIGRSWPTYGDNLSDEKTETFMKDLKKSYNEWVARNKK
jgi:hypothetical protein